MPSKGDMKFQEHILKLMVCSFLFLKMVFCSYPTQANELVVAISHIPPWSIIEQESFHGVNVEILNEFADRFNLTIKYVVCPWKRCLKMMESGKVDIMGTLLKRPERERYMLYIEPPYKRTSTKVFYLKEGRGHLIKEYKDLYGLTIGVFRGAKYFSAFDNDSKLIKHEVTEPLQLLRMLEKGRLDAIIADQLPMDYRLLTHKAFKGMFEKAPYVHESRGAVYMAISKNSNYAKRLPDFNKAMKQLVNNGTVEKIITNLFQRIENAN